MEILLEALTSFGLSGVILGILLYYLNKLTDIHRDERKEWNEANNDHVDKFADVISNNTRALTEMKGELKENRCKMK